MTTLKVMFLMVLFVTPAFAGSGQQTCFYLDRSKVKSGLVPLTLSASTGADSIRLDQAGLFEGKERTCLWALNGGSGTKERFALDGGYAIPILDPACESPFGHQETGVGFGDWYLTICGSLPGNNLVILHKQREFSVPLETLAQWTQYKRGKFPIEGDRE